MLSTKLRRDIDAIWDHIWSNGVSNPITCIEYLSTLLVASRTPARAQLTEALEHRDGRAAASLLASIQQAHDLGGTNQNSETSPWYDVVTVAAAFQMTQDLQVEDRNHDVIGDVFEYMLSKLASAGHFGQFRTPRHLIKFIVSVVDPKPGETILDPAAGTAGFLIAAAEHTANSPGRKSPHFLGEEVDPTVARLARTNVVLHNIPNGEVFVHDSLANDEPLADVILSNPPFAGNVVSERVSHYECGSARTELLFLELMMRRLKPGGRAGVVVPFGVLTSTNAAALYVRSRLIRQNTLTAVVELPSGSFRPYTDIRTALLFWTSGGTTSSVIMAKAAADGYSLDERREPTAENDLPMIEILVKSERADDVVGDGLAAIVTAETLQKQGLVLSPSRYINKSTPPEVITVDLQTTIRDLRTSLANAFSLAQEMEAML